MHRQTSIFDILPPVEDTPTQTYIYDASWDEEKDSQCNSVREQVTSTTKKPAHEHSDNNSSDVTSTTSLLSNTGVREQTTQGFEVAHEHIDISRESVAITTTSLLDTGTLPNNLINGCNGHQQPTQKQPAHWIEKYWVESASKKHWYYRYCYMIGRRQDRTHIGSTSSKAAIEKRAVVLQMIIDDATPEEIISYLKPESRL